MAPLKVRLVDMDKQRMTEYPWLKGHGSIKGSSRTSVWSRISQYPWLKGHGSIKGSVHCEKLGNFQGVSMAERSWLH